MIIIINWVIVIIRAMGLVQQILLHFHFSYTKLLFHSWDITTMWWFIWFFNDVVLVSMLIYWSLMQIREYFPQFGIFCIFQKKWRAGTTIFPISFWQRTFRNWIKKINSEFRISSQEIFNLRIFKKQTLRKQKRISS